MKFEVKNRYLGEVLFVAEIDCPEGEQSSVKLGLAVKWAIKNNVNLYGANLYGANLSHANLSHANLSHADLSHANLSHANLYGANLSHADLSHADLSHADLYGANLYGANLSHVDLSHADLSRANLYGAKNSELVIARTRILPEGDLIGWKKCMYGVLVKVRVPEIAKRSHAFGRKCRAEFVDVLEIIGSGKAVSQHNGTTTYCVGQRVISDHFDEDWTKECSGGIHFFITRIEAENY